MDLSGLDWARDQEFVSAGVLLLGDQGGGCGAAKFDRRGVVVAHQHRLVIWDAEVDGNESALTTTAQLTAPLMVIW
ncbi:hypothetical protein ACWEQG_38605 [Microbispora sp. NPDC004025]